VTGEPKRKTAGDMRWRYEEMGRGLTLAAIETPIADLPALTPVTGRFDPHRARRDVIASPVVYGQGDSGPRS
jgi:hypothetical protein